MNPKEKPEKTEEKEVLSESFLRFLRVFLIVLILFLAIVITTGWGLYRSNWQNAFSETLSNLIPYPIAMVDYTHWVTFKEYNKNVKSIKRFLESKEAAFKNTGFDFSTEDGIKRLTVIKKNVLNQLIEAKIIEILANERGLKIGSKELDEVTEKILVRDGQEKENLTQLSLLYGWDPADFKSQIVKNMLYREKLENLIKKEGELDREGKAKLSKIQTRIKNKDDFGQIAKELSESPSREYNGLIPAFSKEEAPANFASLAFSLSPGEISDPVESEDGWYIIKIERRFNENNTDKVEIRNIFVKRDSFNNWLKNKKSDFKISLPQKEYFWHKEMGKVYFKNDELNKLENEINRASLNENLQAADFLLNETSRVRNQK